MFTCIRRRLHLFIYYTYDPLTLQPTTTLIQEYLKSLSLPTLYGSQNQEPNHPFISTEIDTVISTLPYNKATGPYGYPVKYYKAYSKILSPYLASVFNWVTSKKSFPAEMLSATIITLPKPGKDSSNPTRSQTDFVVEQEHREGFRWNTLVLP